MNDDSSETDDSASNSFGIARKVRQRMTSPREPTVASPELVAANIWRVGVYNDRRHDTLTNCYIVGDDPVIVVDPGAPGGFETVSAALKHLGNPRVRDIVLTHAHRDHGGCARDLREATGAPVWLNPQELIQARARDTDAPLDRALYEGQIIEIAGYRFEAIATPGHAEGHISFIEQETRMLLAGDIVSGSGSIAVFPPYGDMSDYVKSLRRLLELGVSRVLPAHGPVVEDGPALLQRFLDRRLGREAEILTLVTDGLTTIDALTQRLYPDVSPRNRNSARGVVETHIEKLERDGRLRREGDGATASYTAVG